MPLIAYQDIGFQRKSLRMIEQANDIIDDFRAQGYTLTLRQLYYQFVSKDWIPNNEKSYDNLGRLITNARLAGLIDWNAIEDRGRGIHGWLIEEDETEPLNGIEGGFALDFWQRQNVYVEVWIEKDALSSVLRRPCQRWRVPYMPCKGYLSASEAWRAGQRYEAMFDEGRQCVLIHLGDHDPSGIDMTRDNDERLEMFAGQGVDVRRIALNMDQVRRYDPPPNPAKMTDKRAPQYIAQYGPKSWELDALPPKVIETLIEDEIKTLIDFDKWNETKAEERRGRHYLSLLHGEWDSVKEHLAALYGEPEGEDDE